MSLLQSAGGGVTEQKKRYPDYINFTNGDAQEKVKKVKEVKAVEARKSPNESLSRCADADLSGERPEAQQN